MPGSRDSRRLSKNATDLVKGVQHLRPRGSYDPLPPPGGYPLPASIRKKFSFSPELANLSQISLMLDFASSTQDLGIQLDQSEAKKTSNGTPTSLYVHYSLLSLSETLDGRQTLVIPQHSLSGISSASPARHEGSWLGEDEDTDSIMSSGGLIGQQPRLQPSRSLRRMHARDSLRIRDTSSPQTDLYSGSSTHLSSTESTEPSSPRTSLTSSGEDFSDPTTHIGDGPNYTPQSRGHDELEHRLVKRLADDCPNLFGTFFIIDLQLPDNPIRVTSHDIIPTDLAPNQLLLYDDDCMEIPLKLLTIHDGERTIQTLPFEGDLVAKGGRSSQPSHRFIGQIDITTFLKKEIDDNEDVWLMIAYEEMEKAGIRRRDGRPYTNPAVAAPHAEAEQLPRVIQSLHRDYFVIGYSSIEPHFRITLVSPTLSWKEVTHPDFLDWTALEGYLDTPERFITWVRRQTRGLRDKLYCVPMFGPELVCWLCFLVGSDLPPIWPSLKADMAPN